MAHTRTTDVLIVGAGPVGLSAAAELGRHGVPCRIVDRLSARLPYAKAVGIQPRTLEIWDRMGLARTMLEAAALIRGQLIYVNGREQARIDLALPPEVPYRFAALPQYETERLLEEYVAGQGTVVERGTELLSFVQDPEGVTAVLRTPSGAEEEVRAGYLVGCDGAHSTVRKTLGLSFEGGAFGEEYMLGDVEADWDMPHGYGIRSMHLADDGTSDDLLVCIPLPGTGRYRMSMLVPPELSTGTGGPQDGVAHGLEGDRTPELEHIQAVVDRLGPRPAVLSRMRWSSVFRISHRIVDRYGEGRVFVAGDAAHIHPPTGAQGMNTGVQDACNLAWKLAMVLRDEAGPALLESYDAERRPVGEEVIGRTVRHATQGVHSDPDDPGTVMLREAQLLVGYREGPLAGAPYGSLEAPQPGDRAPDCDGLTAPAAAYHLRLLDVLRGRVGHVALLYAADVTDLARAAAEATVAVAPLDAGPGVGLQVVAILSREAAPGAADRLPVPAYRDAAGQFARLYRPDGPTGFVVRPDGHLGTRFPLDGTAAGLAEYVAALSGRTTRRRSAGAARAG
ncbi:FAD-dependent monooxygenase [Streptomyces antibioticus]|uniref:Pentachlorophenol monooxygenase n=1 Tax=Streptomyces antibioticus TaxID=1890 RepID=A0AAE7CP27_STRAT|nr:FAD-dependent monooxygenase [Streptomyces antibioticus]OOQ47777.1 pentachlorophenol monooxygenase [Streptomyces antibioticus]QIT48097.1 pentachlorophenol monooxygenase [Streptomyces antibioticus]